MSDDYMRDTFEIFQKYKAHSVEEIFSKLNIYKSCKKGTKIVELFKRKTCGNNDRLNKEHVMIN